MTLLTQSAIQPSAERYFIFLLLFVFSLCERKNEQQMKELSLLLSQAQSCLYATLHKFCDHHK